MCGATILCQSTRNGNVSLSLSRMQANVDSPETRERKDKVVPAVPMERMDSQECRVIRDRRDSLDPPVRRELPVCAVSKVGDNRCYT